MIFDLQIAARTIRSEARGEPEAGQRAVAHVIVNRLRSNRWGPTLASVCVWDRQFSCWNNSDPNRVSMVSLSENDPDVVRFAGFIEGALSRMDPDPTQGAMFYYNPAAVTAKPAWDQGQSFIQIGKHRFFQKDSA